MTIHPEHPFQVAPDQRDPVRRWRGRLGGTVSLWTSGTGKGPTGRAGLTVSSLLIAAGEPGHVLGLLDPDSTLAERLLETRTTVVQLLEWRHRDLADAFAGVAPAPGGVFTLGEWVDSEWGPRLADASSWAGARLVETDPVDVGWSILVDLVIEYLEVGEEHKPLVHRRGRYQRPS
ncbi:MAG: flavin reductase family protein [Nocardioidaceae bacterium]